MNCNIRRLNCVLNWYEVIATALYGIAKLYAGPFSLNIDYVDVVCLNTSTIHVSVF